MTFTDQYVILRSGKTATGVSCRYCGTQFPRFADITVLTSHPKVCKVQPGSRPGPEVNQ